MPSIGSIYAEQQRRAAAKVREIDGRGVVVAMRQIEARTPSWWDRQPDWIVRLVLGAWIALFVALFVVVWYTTSPETVYLP